jgi:PEP-CTERM motif
MHMITRPLLSALLVMAAAGSSQAATVYDAVADFSTTVNTASSTWSYRTSTSAVRDGNYPLFPAFGVFAGFTGPPAGTSGWRAAGVPAIGVNTTGADQFFTSFGPGAQFTWPAGSMYMHPGGSTLAVVSWLSPSPAILSISFRFADMDANANFPDGVNWSVEKNSGGASLASGSFANGGNSGSLSLSNITVAAGDRIHFIVGGNADFQGDSTRLSATIVAAPVPEPATWALGMLGAVGLLALRGRLQPAPGRVRTTA